MESDKLNMVAFYSLPNPDSVQSTSDVAMTLTITVAVADREGLPLSLAVIIKW